MKRNNARKAMMQKPSLKALRAGYDAQRPLDTAPVETARKPRRKLADDEIDDIGEPRD